MLRPAIRLARLQIWIWWDAVSVPQANKEAQRRAVASLCECKAHMHNYLDIDRTMIPRARLLLPVGHSVPSSRA